MQLDVFPEMAFLKREERSKNIRRFYLMSIQPDLFGGTWLVREWGRIGSSGQVRLDFHPDDGSAINALDAFSRQKQKRGYRLV